MKGLLSGVFHSLPLYSSLLHLPPGNTSLLPPSLLYLFSWTQNLIAEKNTNKPTVLVTLGSINLRVYNLRVQNVGLTYLEGLIRVGPWNDWTISSNTQVFSLCSQWQLRPQAVFSVVRAPRTNH